MATDDNGSIPTTTPPMTEDAAFNLDSDLERMRQTLNDALSKLQRLEDMKKVIGTSSDNEEHCIAVQKNIEELLSDTNKLAIDSLHVSLDGIMAQMIKKSQSDNPLSSGHTSGPDDDDSDKQAQGDVTVTSSQMEEESRKWKKLQALAQDVIDLNSLRRYMEELEDTQEDSRRRIERNIEDATSYVTEGHRGIQMGVVVRRKRRKFIAIIICVVVGVVIVVVLVSLAIIVTSVCVSTEQCSK